jgi:hypothetical protein
MHRRTGGSGLDATTYLSVGDVLALAHHNCDDADVRAHIRTALPAGAELVEGGETEATLGVDDLLDHAQDLAECGERGESIRRARSLWRARSELDREIRTDGGTQTTFDERGHAHAPPAGHLTGERPTDATTTHAADGDREWWCVDCRRRVTRSNDGEGEFGHCRECEHHFQRRAGE